MVETEPSVGSGVYLAGPLGFSEPGRYYHQRLLKPAITALGVEVLDPWPEAEAIFGQVALIDDSEDPIALLAGANRAVGRSNSGMIERCSAVLAILDGADVDSGTAAEIGFAAALHRPVVGLRTDIRLSGDNRAAVVNLQVQFFIEASGGLVVTSLQEALDALRQLPALRVGGR